MVGFKFDVKSSYLDIKNIKKYKKHGYNFKYSEIESLSIHLML